MTRPNWFIAFPLDGSFVSQLPPPPPSIRLCHPEDVHLTLCFLGGCGEVAALAALAALDEVLAHGSPAPLPIALGEVVPLGPRARFSALSALLSAGREQTCALMSTLRDAPTLAARGRLETRAPLAHVTVARPIRQASEARRQQALAWAASLRLTHVRASLTRVALYTWSADRHLRAFRIVAERPLLAPSTS